MYPKLVVNIDSGLAKSTTGLLQQRVWVKDSAARKGHFRMQWVKPLSGGVSQKQHNLFDETETGNKDVVLATKKDDSLKTLERLCRNERWGIRENDGKRLLVFTWGAGTRGQIGRDAMGGKYHVYLKDRNNGDSFDVATHDLGELISKVKQSVIALETKYTDAQHYKPKEYEFGSYGELDKLLRRRGIIAERYSPDSMFIANRDRKKDHAYTEALEELGLRYRAKPNGFEVFLSGKH